MAEMDIKKIADVCEELNTSVGYNQIDTNFLVRNLERYCYITRSIPIFRNNYIDVILDLTTGEFYIETRENNIIIDYGLLSRVNKIYEIIESYNEEF